MGHLNSVILEICNQVVQKQTMTNWDDHRFFLAIARECSVRRAAKSLGVSHSTVLRRITAFEDDLGVRLFERLPTGYFTTAAGEELLQSAQRIEEEAMAAGRRVAGRDNLLSGKLRVSLPGALATHLLMPDLVAFERENPEITLEFELTYIISDLAKREADVAIRLSNDPPGDLVGRRVLHMSSATYVSRQWLEKIGEGRALHGLKWVGFSAVESSQWQEDSGFADLPMGISIEDPVARMEAVRAGAGMAILPCFMADGQRDLHRVPPGTVQPHKDVWVLTHKDLRNAARIRKFTDFMAEALRKNRNLLEGKCWRQ